MLVDRHDVGPVQRLRMFCSIELNTESARVTGLAENCSGSNLQFRTALNPQAGQLDPATGFKLGPGDYRSPARERDVRFAHSCPLQARFNTPTAAPGARLFYVHFCRND